MMDDFATDLSLTESGSTQTQDDALEGILDEAAAPRGLWCGQGESFGPCRGD